MQNVRTLGKASSLPSRPAPDARQRSLSLQAGHISSRWWKRSASIATIGYVLFSQTLHAVEGWSRLGVAFAGLLVFILVLGRATGVWSFKNEKWLWVPAPFLFYCLIRAFPEAGNDWPVEQLFPLICAFSGGIGTALALQVAVPFRAVVYAQVASNLCNIAAALIGVGTDAPSGMDEVRYAGVTGNANAFGLQLALGGCLIWLLPKKAGVIPCLFAFVGVAYAVATSGSRTALMVAPFFLFLVFVQIVGSLKQHRAVFVCSVIGAIFLAGITLGPTVFEHAKDITAVNRMLDHQDSSFDTRLWMIRKGLSLWRESPFVGNGLDGFERLSGHPGYAHNNYVELLCNSGLIGFVLFYGMHAFILFKSFWLKGSLKLYPWGFIILLLLIDIGSINYDNKQTIMILLILLSIPVFPRRGRLAKKGYPAVHTGVPNNQSMAPRPTYG